MNIKESSAPAAQFLCFPPPACLPMAHSASSSWRGSLRSHLRRRRLMSTLISPEQKIVFVLLCCDRLSIYCLLYLYILYYKWRKWLTIEL